jgi:hypothetical protein
MPTKKDTDTEITSEQIGRLERVNDVLWGHGTCIEAALDALEDTLEPGDRRNVHLKALRHLCREMGGQHVELDAVLGELLRSNETR